MAGPGTTRRRYRGQTPEERDAERRERLLAAGLELFGTRGWNGTSIEELCRRARVTTRSFYELYAGREQLFLDVYDRLVERLLAGVRAAVAAAPAELEARLRAGLEATVAAYSRDPRLARVVLVEVHGISRAVEEHRRRAIGGFAELAAGALSGLAGPEDRERAHVAGVALVGAITELLASRAGGGEPSDELIVDELVRIFLGSIDAR